MHSAAIFCGVLVFSNGASTMVMLGTLIDFAILNDPPRAPGLARWMPYIMAAATLGLPVSLMIGGGVLMRWGLCVE